MKILVIGGSYFFGRVFVMQAVREHDITVANRGTYSMAELGVRQITGDRRDASIWKACVEDYDVIVDFCAYEEGDIARVLRNLQGNIGQYVFISTVDVYERGRENGEKTKKDEETPLEQRVFSGEAGTYIAGKTALEKELTVECARRNINYTILRPAILYGPFNYAPRESEYIRMIVQNGVLPRITGAAGRFQFLYVKDAAEAVLKCLLNETAYGQAYNLCGDEILTYDSFLEGLKEAADVEMQEIPIPYEQAGAQGIPLPFPATDEETELYSNEKSKRELGMDYTGFPEGMAKTYRAFKGVYTT